MTIGKLINNFLHTFLYSSAISCFIDKMARLLNLSSLIVDCTQVLLRFNDEKQCSYCSTDRQCQRDLK